MVENPLSRQDAEKFVESIGIPPRPAVVLAVMDEKSKDEPDLMVIAEVISRDVGIAAALLKTVNSPLFGLPRKVQSVTQAVGLLGLSRVATLMNSLALKTSLGGPGIERFWDQSARTAMICAWLAGKLGHDRDSAYLFGLFRDAGIPLLIRRFKNYKDTLRQANQDERGFTAVEDERHGMNHAIVGAILARNWHLDESVRNAIRSHHQQDVFHSSDDRTMKNLIAVSHLAGQLECRYSRNRDDGEWKHFAQVVQTWLMISDEDIDPLTQEVGSLLLESGL
jgi:HD-like signal output (HDOD) protein